MKKQKETTSSDVNQDNPKLSPAVKKLVAENNLSADKISPSRSDGRLTKEDVFNFHEYTINKKDSFR